MCRANYVFAASCRVAEALFEVICAVHCERGDNVRGVHSVPFAVEVDVYGEHCDTAVRLSWFFIKYRASYSFNTRMGSISV